MICSRLPAASIDPCAASDIPGCQRKNSMEGTHMENIIVVNFEVESEAYQAFSELKGKGLL